MPRLPIALLAALLLWSCQPTPAITPTGATPKPVKPTASRSPGAEATEQPGATKRITFDVRVMAPATGAAGATQPWDIVAGAPVQLVFAESGLPLPEITPLKTNAEGRVTFVVRPPAAPILARVTVGSVTLLRIFSVSEGAVATVDPSTSLVSAYYLGLRVGERQAIERVDASRVEGLATTVRLKLADPALAASVELVTANGQSAAFQAMISGDSKLQERAIAALGGTRINEQLATPTPERTVTPF